MEKLCIFVAGVVLCEWECRPAFIKPLSTMCASRTAQCNWQVRGCVADSVVQSDNENLRKRKQKQVMYMEEIVHKKDKDKNRHHNVCLTT